jgi:hypothetical protein
MLPLDLLGIPFARAVHVRIQMPGIGAPMISIKANESKGLEGGVSNVDIAGNNALQIKAIGVVISTFETLPRAESETISPFSGAAAGHKNDLMLHRKVMGQDQLHTTWCSPTEQTVIPRTSGKCICRKNEKILLVILKVLSIVPRLDLHCRSKSIEKPTQ